MVSVPPPSLPRRKETVLKLCVVSLIVWCCALPVPRRKKNIRKPCVVSSSMQNGVCPAALIAATQRNCPETLRRVLDRVVLRPSHAATQGKHSKTLRRVLVYAEWCLSRRPHRRDARKTSENFASCPRVCRMVSVPPPSSPRRKETVLKLCVVAGISKILCIVSIIP